jgi:hypothetical protein
MLKFPLKHARLLNSWQSLVLKNDIVAALIHDILFEEVVHVFEFYTLCFIQKLSILW